MTRWSCCVFQFLLAVTEVNFCHAWNQIFVQEDMFQQDFCKLFAQELINNPYFSAGDAPTVETRSQKVHPAHEAITMAPFKNIKNMSGYAIIKLIISRRTVSYAPNTY